MLSVVSSLDKMLTNNSDNVTTSLGEKRHQCVRYNRRGAGGGEFLTSQN